jgi:hypothetical protein
MKSVMKNSLVLCIEEHDYLDDEFDSIDNKIYIGYDLASKRFVVLGKRVDIDKKEYSPYRLAFSSLNHLSTFIGFTVSLEDNSSIILYNLPFENHADSIKNVDHYFLEKRLSEKQEISGYNNKTARKHVLKKLLNMIVDNEKSLNVVNHL